VASRGPVLRLRAAKGQAHSANPWSVQTVLPQAPPDEPGVPSGLSAVPAAAGTEALARHHLNEEDER